MGIVVVTGAASGMGAACVARLRAEADVVVAVDLDEPDLDGVVAIGCDVSAPDAVAALAARVGELGSFQALVHAAGISPTMSDARRIFAVNLVGTQLLLDAFEPLVQPGGAAVVFSSSSAYNIAPFVTQEQEELLADPAAQGFVDRAVATTDDSGYAYALSKHGVIRAAERAAVRWARRGGRVNSLSPGLIDTPMGRRELAQQPVMQDMLAATPLARQGRPDEVAALAAFLISDAASFINGVDVLIDGGMIAALRQAGRG